MPPGVASVQVRELARLSRLPLPIFTIIPRKALQLVAVTGTNGKTTTTSVIDAIIKASNAKTGLFGTIAYHTPRGEYPAPNTTPESVDLQGFLAEIRDAGGKVRGAGSQFAFADNGSLVGLPFLRPRFSPTSRASTWIITKLSKIISPPRKRCLMVPERALPTWQSLTSTMTTAKSLAGLAEKHRHLRPRKRRRHHHKKIPANVSMDWPSRRKHPTAKSRSLPAWWGASTCTTFLPPLAPRKRWAFPMKSSKRVSANLESVSGRFQRIDQGQPFLVIVDYAHTDDALESLIRTARELNPKGRIITLFGCGGSKDRTKRPVMGEVTGRLSDLTILSSDNPRSEDPLKIISDIIVGLQKTSGKYVIEPDREKAIGAGDGRSARRRHCAAGRKRPRELSDSCRPHAGI